MGPFIRIENRSTLTIDIPHLYSEMVLSPFFFFCIPRKPRDAGHYFLYSITTGPLGRNIPEKKWYKEDPSGSQFPPTTTIRRKNDINSPTFHGFFDGKFVSMNMAISPSASILRRFHDFRGQERRTYALQFPRRPGGRETCGVVECLVHWCSLVLQQVPNVLAFS